MSLRTSRREVNIVVSINSFLGSNATAKVLFDDDIVQDEQEDVGGTTQTSRLIPGNPTRGNRTTRNAMNA